MHRRQFLASSALGLAALRLSRFAYAGNAASTPLALPEALKNNPLLDFSGLPTFSAFTPAIGTISSPRCRMRLTS